MSAENTDERILELRRAGFRNDSMKLLMDQYFRMIWSIAFRMVNNHEEAMDITQEALIQIDGSIDSFRGNSRLSTWIYSLTSRVCLRKKRDSSRNNRDAFTGNEEWLNSRKAPSYEEPDSVCEKRHREKLIEAGLQKLHEDRRLAIILHDIEGISVSETAGIMERSIASVKSLIHRGRKDLRNILGEGSELPGYEGTGRTSLTPAGLQ